MNQKNERRNKTDVDPAVSDLIKTLSNQTTPEGLDRAVMLEAKRAIRADNRRGSFGAWFRPVAFMATVGLSLAIILDLSDTSIFTPASDSAFEPPTPSIVPPPVNRTPDAAARNRGQATLNELKRQEKSSTADRQGDDTPGEDREVAAGAVPTAQGGLSKLRPELAPTNGEEVSAAFSAESRKTVERVRNLEADHETGPPLQAATETYSETLPAECSETQKSVPDEWWQCIASLREAGQAEAAARELQELRSAYPDFEPPL